MGSAHLLKRVDSCITSPVVYALSPAGSIAISVPLGPPPTAPRMKHGSRRIVLLCVNLSGVASSLPVSVEAIDS